MALAASMDRVRWLARGMHLRAAAADEHIWCEEIPLREHRQIVSQATASVVDQRASACTKRPPTFVERPESFRIAEKCVVQISAQQDLLAAITKATSQRHS